MKATTWLLALAAIGLTGCGGVGGDPKEMEVKRAVEWSRRTLDRTQRDPMSAAALGSNMEAGGTIVAYIAANMPDGAKFTGYEMGKPTHAYSVTFREDGPYDVTIEGWGKSLDQPIVTEKAHLGPTRRGGEASTAPTQQP